jgi:hypothetical protein
MSFRSRKSLVPTRAARWLCLAKGLGYEAVTLVHDLCSGVCGVKFKNKRRYTSTPQTQHA